MEATILSKMLAVCPITLNNLGAVVLTVSAKSRLLKKDVICYWFSIILLEIHVDMLLLCPASRTQWIRMS